MTSQDSTDLDVEIISKIAQEESPEADNEIWIKVDWIFEKKKRKKKKI